MKKSVFENIPTSNPQTPRPNLISRDSGQAAVISYSPLDEDEHESLSRLLSENVNSEESELDRDIFEVSRITSEINSVRKQGAVLLGERIFQVQKTLKSYKDGTFTKWLTYTFGSRQTGYNILAYYELYQFKENITQKVLAEAICISQHHISEMENGRRLIEKEMGKRFTEFFKVDYRLFL